MHSDGTEACPALNPSCGLHRCRGRAIVNEATSGKFTLLIEGIDMVSVMSTRGIDGTSVLSNHIMLVSAPLARGNVFSANPGCLQWHRTTR